MSFRFRRRGLALRSFCVVLLLLAVVLKPALVVASEAHQSGHYSQTGHAHDPDLDAPGIPAHKAHAPHGSEALESGHYAQAGHVHDPEPDGPGIPAGEADTSHGSDAWHLLMHLGHCCNPSTGLAAVGFEFSEPPPPDHPPLARQAQPRGAEGARDLRPPIAG